MTTFKSGDQVRCVRASTTRVGFLGRGGRSRRMADDRKKYEADVAYEVWRNGGNPDLTYEQSYYDYRDGLSVDDSAAGHFRRSRHSEDEE